MAIPGRVEEGLIQHRYGYSHDLPDYLEEAEIAMTVDTGGVFIGAPLFKAIDGRERSYSNKYPYHNIEILTEVSNNSEIIKVPFNIFNTALNMPIVLIALNQPVVTTNDVISVNGTQLRILQTDTTIQAMVKTFNNIFKDHGVEDISFDIYESKFKITFYSKNGESLILDSLTTSSLQHFGFINDTDTNIIHKVVTPNKMTSRTLSEILSDRISIKTFGVVNNEDDNCSILTNSAIDLLYRSKQNFLKKDLFLPAGKYSYETDAIYLTSNASMLGEYNTTLSFNNLSIIRMISNTDILGYYRQSSMFGITDGDIKHIKLENLNLESDLALNGIELYGVSDLNINNVNVKSNQGQELLSIKALDSEFTFLKNISNIDINSSVLENGVIGLYIHGFNGRLAQNIRIKNVKFKNISDTCLLLENCKNVVIENCDFSDVTNTGLLMKFTSCEKVVVRNCIYPDNFSFEYGSNNKILFNNSEVDIQDKFEKVINLDGHTNIIHLSNNTENYNIILNYDILSTGIKNRSGQIIMSRLESGFNSGLLADTSASIDSNIIFEYVNGSASGNELKLVANNTSSSTALMRYNIHFTTLKNEY